jgi:hypothetical protein
LIHKKGKIGRLGFGSSSDKYNNLKKFLSERGKLWKSVKNVDFHMILPSKKMIITNTCNYLHKGGVSIQS